MAIKRGVLPTSTVNISIVILWDGTFRTPFRQWDHTGRKYPASPASAVMKLVELALWLDRLQSREASKSERDPFCIPHIYWKKFFHLFTVHFYLNLNPLTDVSVLAVMATFTVKQIMGTSFQITERYSDLRLRGLGAFGVIWYTQTPSRNLRYILDKFYG